MRILILSKESRGGTGNLLRQLQGLGSYRNKLDIYLYKKDPQSPLIKDYSFINKSYPSTHAPSLTKILLLFFNNYLTFRLLQKQKYDIIFTCDHYSSIQILFLKYLHVVPFPRGGVIVLENNNLKEVIAQKPTYFFRFFLKQVTRALYKRADRIVTTSSRLREQTSTYLPYPANNICHIPRGIDFASLNKRKTADVIYPEVFKNAKGIKIITVGRLEKQKDFNTIIRSFAIVKRQNKNKQMNLFIIGEGSEEGQLKTFVRKHKLSSFVHFLGWQKNVYPFLTASDIFVFSSTHEGFGTVLIEAMACGLPIISTNTPHGPSEILNEGDYGLLVPMHDYKKMAVCLTKLIKNKVLRLSYAKKGEKRSKIYNEKIMLKRLNDLFKQAHEKMKNE